MEWTELQEFKGIDLNDSFILNWSKSKNGVSFNLEASIWPSSKYYQAPKATEHTCYKKAVLSFISCQDITGLKTMQQANSSIDPDGSEDYGNIDSLKQTTNGFKLSGDFGNVHIKGGKLVFTVLA